MCGDFTLLISIFLILRTLLSITFPQELRISKNIWHLTLGSGGKKTFNRNLKSEHAHGKTHGRTFQLIESIGPEGGCFENYTSPKILHHCWRWWRWHLEGLWKWGWHYSFKTHILCKWDQYPMLKTWPYERNLKKTKAYIVLLETY